MKKKFWLALISVAILIGAFWVDDEWRLSLPTLWQRQTDYTYTLKIDTMTAFQGSRRLRYTVKRSDNKEWSTSETVVIVGRSSGYNVHVTQPKIKNFKCDITSDFEYNIKKNSEWTFAEKVTTYTVRTDFLNEKFSFGPRFIIRCLAVDVTFTDPDTGKKITSVNEVELHVTKNIVENFYRPDIGFDRYLGTYVLNFSAAFNGKPFYNIATESNIYKSF